MHEPELKFTIDIVKLAELGIRISDMSHARNFSYQLLESFFT